VCHASVTHFTGRLEEDRGVMIEVLAETFNVAWWRGYADTLKQRFVQESIHLRATISGDAGLGREAQYGTVDLTGATMTKVSLRVDIS
jgi:hypothetical protein